LHVSYSTQSDPREHQRISSCALHAANVAVGWYTVQIRNIRNTNSAAL
jgi:hypothetical protein